MPKFFITSATSAEGKEDLLDYIGSINDQLEINN